MNREIKFRYWDTNKFVYFDFTNVRDLNYEDARGCEITEFTGLKDKNGKEIYEGDILDAKYKWVVKFSNGCFKCYSSIDTSDKSPISLADLIFSRIRAEVPLKVIGNIYENPELLNGGKK